AGSSNVVVHNSTVVVTGPILLNHVWRNHTALLLSSSIGQGGAGMRIKLRWNLDRPPWQSCRNTRRTRTTSPTGTTVVTGPLGLLGILQTRLGTTRPTVNRPVRIAQYRALMSEADHPWYRRSFTTDSWNTAHHLLR